MAREIKSIKDIVSLQVKGATNVAYKIVADTSRANFDMGEFGKITGSSVAKDIIEKYLDKEQTLTQEVFGIMCLNRQNYVIGIFQPFSGGISSTIADVTILSAISIGLLAQNAIVFHNHPSGSIRPSDADRILTKQIKQAFEPLKITLLDHIILAPAVNGYYSFADEGLL
jgi:DNA repair protein RadC